MNIKAIKYGTKKAPPPYSYANEGNLHTFPNPTANPTVATVYICKIWYGEIKCSTTAHGICISNTY